MFTDGKPFLLVPSVSSNGLQFPEGRAKTNTRHTEKGTSVRAMLFQFTEIGRSGGGRPCIYKCMHTDILYSFKLN